MISFILPTHDRPQQLQRTLCALGSNDCARDMVKSGGEVIVVDNASAEAVHVDASLMNGLPVRVIRRRENEAAAGRNFAAQVAANPWLVMLDDDSYPVQGDLSSILNEAEDDVAAVGARIVLPSGAHEDGGLPEVFIGCGVAIRRDAFLDAGGYDPAFHYYVEEYDLAARLIRAGWRIIHDFRFVVRHEKTNAGRDMNLIVHRLVRNNAWVMQRYSPHPICDRQLAEIIERYSRVAVRERAATGFASGMAELATTLPAQPRREMTSTQFDRFCGLAAVRESLADEPRDWRGLPVAIVAQGKNSWVVGAVLAELGSEIVDPDEAEIYVIGTISPGPVIDAMKAQAQAGHGRPVIPPWRPRFVDVGPIPLPQ